MDTDLDLLTALLLDPFLTTDEAARQAAATPRRPAAEAASRRPAEGSRRPDPCRPLPALDF